MGLFPFLSCLIACRCVRWILHLVGEERAAYIPSVVFAISQCLFIVPLSVMGRLYSVNFALPGHLRDYLLVFQKYIETGQSIIYYRIVRRSWNPL